MSQRINPGYWGVIDLKRKLKREPVGPAPLVLVAGIESRINLKPMESDPIDSHDLAHHGDALQRFWYGTPHWKKIKDVGDASRVTALVVDSGCDECNQG